MKEIYNLFFEIILGGDNDCAFNYYNEAGVGFGPWLSFLLGLLMPVIFYRLWDPPKVSMPKFLIVLFTSIFIILGINSYLLYNDQNIYNLCSDDTMSYHMVLWIIIVLNTIISAAIFCLASLGWKLISVNNVHNPF